MLALNQKILLTFQLKKQASVGPQILKKTVCSLTQELEFLFYFDFV